MRRLLFRGFETFPARRGAIASDFPTGAILVHSVPPGSPELKPFIETVRPSRVVYISSTGVYGSAIDVDASTPTQDCPRLEEEAWIRSGAWSHLILRPAAIYGPGRGVHMRVMEGKLARGAGSGVTSRIHVDDLAAIVEAGALSNLTGAWPCADTRPCSSEEISNWCSRLLRIDIREPVLIPQSGRRVDGRAILDALGLRLIYPDYEAGILASLASHTRPPPAGS